MPKEFLTLSRLVLLQAALFALLATVSVVKDANAAQTSCSCTNLPSGGTEDEICEIPQQNLCSPSGGNYCVVGGGAGGGCLSGECSVCTDWWKPCCY